jgi:predicted RNA-binding Zn ribbon-like protein
MPNTGTANAASIELVGGHVAVDLVNTVSWRLDPDRRRDNLSDAAALAAWLPRVGVLDARQAHELLTEPTGSRGRRALAEVRVLREQLHGMLDRIAGGESLDGLVAPRELTRRLAAAVAHGELRGSPMHWRLTVREPGDIPRLLALEALDLLESPRLPLLRRCQGPGCAWLFLDGSRSHTRRWCSSLDCGNRDRARRHYARHRAASSG